MIKKRKLILRDKVVVDYISPANIPGPFETKIKRLGFVFSRTGQYKFGCSECKLQERCYGIFTTSPSTVRISSFCGEIYKFVSGHDIFYLCTDVIEEEEK